MNLDPIGPRIYLAEEEAAVSVALDDSNCAGVDLGCLDLGIWNHRAALVRNGPSQGTTCPALR